MDHSSSRLRWLRILGAGLAVIPLCFLILIAITTCYAFVSAFQARGAPDQSAINHFAAKVSPRLMPWLEMLVTLVVAIIVARKTDAVRHIDGLFIGILAGLLSLALILTLVGRLGWHNLVFILLVVGLGWLGGILGQTRMRRT